MRNIRLYLVCLGLMVLSAGCNDGLFIEDYRTDVRQLRMEGTDAEATLRFKNNNWLMEGRVVHALSNNLSFVYNIKEETGNYTSGVFSVSSAGRLTLRHPLIDMDIEASGAGELKIRVLENLLPGCKIQLRFTEKHSYGLEQLITVDVAPARYTVDEVKYTLNTWTEHRKEETKELMKVDTDQQLKVKVFPFKEEYRKVQFINMYYYSDAMGYGILFNPYHLFDEREEVGTPTIDAHGWQFEMKGDKAPFNVELQRFPLSNADREEVVEITESGTTVIKKYVKYVGRELDCTVHAHNIQTGKKRVFSGSFHYEQPEDIRIYKEKQTN